MIAANDEIIDPLVLNDELLDHLGKYYTSEMVSICKPWIREIPFEIWLDRQLTRLRGFRENDMLGPIGKVFE